MTLQSSGRSRERVLLYGMEGTGKSLAALDVAARIHPHMLHVIDNDNAWDRMLEGTTLDGEQVQVAAEFRWNDEAKDFTPDYSWSVEGGNIIVWHTWDAADGWRAGTAAMDAVRHEVAENGSAQDWVLVDTGGQLWSDVQDWFIGKVFNQSVEDYFMQVRMEKEAAKKGSKSLGALDGWMDWPVINKEYAARAGKFFVNPPCNLLVTAELAEVSGEDDSQTRALYTLGVKPKGQKRLGHSMQTVIMLRKDRGGSWYAHTLKDRGGREYLDAEDITGYGFGAWYLSEVAGWVEEDAPAQTPVAPAPKVKSVAKKIVAKG